MRIFCMAYFRWTVEEFEQVWNPSNCEIWMLEKAPDGRYELRGRRSCGPPGEASFKDIRCGANQSEPLHEHMKRQLNARTMDPGDLLSSDCEMLSHLRVQCPA